MTGLFFSRPCTSLTSAHPLRGFPRAGPFDAASELARVAEELKGVEGERKAVGADFCSGLAQLRSGRAGRLFQTFQATPRGRLSDGQSLPLTFRFNQLWLCRTGWSLATFVGSPYSRP